MRLILLSNFNHIIFQVQDYSNRLEEYDKKFEESSRKFQTLLTVSFQSCVLIETRNFNGRIFIQ